MLLFTRFILNKGFIVRPRCTFIKCLSNLFRYDHIKADNEMRWMQLTMLNNSLVCGKNTAEIRNRFRKV